MSTFKIGSEIRIPCNTNPGPFDDEVMVEFDTIDGKVSGFTSTMNITEKGGQQYISGIIKAVEGEVATVKVEGSFFTTNGLATVKSKTVEGLPIAA